LAPKQAEPLRRIGIDETAARRGHQYLTVVADLERKQVEFVTENRKQESIDRFYQTRPQGSWEQVEAIAPPRRVGAVLHFHIDACAGGR
jgi:transposase